ncbi:MAG: hypothetical protein J6386_08590 [Candidatus Synoicihabitans palmerolidicus]|nr:hypothetical protein [Candidatus Synoicihabitans palmerolidicus]
MQFDIRHATAERGVSWPNELRLAASKIATLALQDFAWREDPSTHRGQLIDTPIAAGWVDFPRYFSLLNEHAVTAPASLHLEYDIGGAQHGHRQLTCPPAQVYSTMRRDFAQVKTLAAAVN